VFVLYTIIQNNSKNSKTDFEDKLNSNLNFITINPGARGAFLLFSSHFEKLCRIKKEKKKDLHQKRGGMREEGT
jgi:hypothetical protein